MDPRLSAEDAALMRAWELFLEGLSDSGDSELDRLLLTLLAVGYVSADDWGDEWYLWRFTDKGIARAKELEATS